MAEPNFFSNHVGKRMVIEAFLRKISSDFAFTGGVSASKSYQHFKPYDTIFASTRKGCCMFENKKIAVIGAGKLGEALITGMIDAGIVSKDQFIATAAHRERLELIRTRLQVGGTLSNAEAVRK